jgi:hypothetical protein
LLFSTLALGQNAGKPETAEAAATVTGEAMSPADFLIEVSPWSTGDQTYKKEAQTITRILSSNELKSPILIDEHGYARDLVLEAVAACLARDPQGKKLYRVNWNTLLATGKDEATLNATLAGILKYAEASKAKLTIYLDDIASFSTSSPMHGQQVARALHAALSKGKIQVLTAADGASFEHQIAADVRLRPRFEKVEILKGNEDPFVGDKLAPELREMVAGADRITGLRG